jgi:hypothetical protein
MIVIVRTAKVQKLGSALPCYFWGCADLGNCPTNGDLAETAAVGVMHDSPLCRQMQMPWKSAAKREGRRAQRRALWGSDLGD